MIAVQLQRKAKKVKAKTMPSPPLGPHRREKHILQVTGCLVLHVTGCREVGLTKSSVLNIATLQK